MKDNLKGVGIWGQRHCQYLKENKPSVIGVMGMKGTLISYLQSVDERADEMCFQLVKQIAKQEGVIEELNRRDQMAWGAGLRWRPLPKAEAPTEAAAESGAMNGALLENYAVSEIMKSYQSAGKEPYLYYYRDRDAKEIDVIMEGDGKLCPLKIKKTAMPDKRIVKTFGVIDKAPLKIGTGAVLCMAESLSAFDKDNLIIPIWMI